MVNNLPKVSMVVRFYHKRVGVCDREWLPPYDRRVYRISRVEVEPTVLKKGKRNALQPCGWSRIPGLLEAELAGLDDGDIWLTQFNGSGDLDNLVAMNCENRNRSGGTWYSMEEEWASALKEVPPRKVTVDIQPV